EDGGGVFDGALETVPVRGGDALQGGGRGVTKVEDDEAEASAVEDEVGGLEGGLQAVTTLDPEELAEVGAGFAGGGWVEGVGGVDKGGDFSSFCCSCEEGVS
ncbi:MAG: hypothetical protein ABI822_28100, partial [Bryobacteraceae bacterium]